MMSRFCFVYLDITCDIVVNGIYTYLQALTLPGASACWQSSMLLSSVVLNPGIMLL